MEKIGPYLKAVRKKLTLTLREVQKATSISNAYLSQLENGKIKQPSPSVLHRLATCYKESYNHLLRLAGYPLPKHSEGERGNPSFRLGTGFDDLTDEDAPSTMEPNNEEGGGES